MEELSEIADVASGKEMEMDEREAKFLNYWMTTTVTWTYTSFTTTSTIGSVYCTPPGMTEKMCPNNG